MEKTAAVAVRETGLEYHAREGKARYLVELAVDGRGVAAAARAKVAYRTVMGWVKGDKEFAERVEEIREEARLAYLEKCEEKVDALAFEGQEQWVWLKGEKKEMARLHEPKLIELRLKKLDPAGYGGGAVGVQVGMGVQVTVLPAPTKNPADEYLER